jgi:hypothetical protein
VPASPGPEKLKRPPPFGSVMAFSLIPVLADHHPSGLRSLLAIMTTGLRRSEESEPELVALNDPLHASLDTNSASVLSAFI